MQQIKPFYYYVTKLFDLNQSFTMMIYKSRKCTLFQELIRLPNSLTCPVRKKIPFSYNLYLVTNLLLSHDQNLCLLPVMYKIKDGWI